jgi:gluconolactonase
MRTELVLSGLVLALFLAALVAASEQKEPAMTKQTPKARIEILDDACKAALAPDAEVRQIAGGLKFTEGPAWMPEGQFLVFSDIPADTLYRWDEAGGLKVWREGSHNSNGNTVDGQGRLVTCEHGARRVTRTDKDGKVEVLASTCNGKRFNSPNDVVVKGDGSIWFTDPPYGLPQGQQREQDKNYVFRLDPGAKEPVVVASDFDMPNGLCFSPDEKLLYIADSGKPHHVRRFRVKADNTLEGGEVFTVISPGVPDGMRIDRDGRLFSTAGDGVHIFSPEGKLLGKIRTPKTAANCAFGGPDKKTLFITANSEVWAVRLNVPGAR